MTLPSAIIEYDSGTPKFKGVYACRLPDDEFKEHFRDLFLFWDGNRWSYLGSDQRYSGLVPYFLGPLRRRMQDAPG